MQKTNVTMSLDIDASIKPLYLDRYRIQTALFNIIQNSLEAMPSGGEIFYYRPVRARGPDGINNSQGYRHRNVSGNAG